MSYTKTNWVNDNQPPISAANLQNMEDGIKANNTSIGDLNSLNTSYKDTLVNAINEVSTKATGVVGKVLWINNDTTSQFAAQTITLDESLDNYDMYEILFLQSTQNTRTMTTGKVPVGNGTILTFVTTNNFYRPTGTTVSGSSMSVEDSKASTGGGTPSVVNDSTIPYMVIAYKTGLFDEDDTEGGMALESI